MSKRNFFIFIVILLVAVLVLWGLFAWLRSDTPGGQVEEGTNFFSRFNPFGNPRPITEEPDPEEPGPVTDPIDTSEIRLRRVSSMPVAGFGVFQKERYVEINPTPALPLSGEGEVSNPPAKGDTGDLTPPETEFAPALRYVARLNGNIYQTFADKLDERKFSATLVPKVYEAHFGNQGEAVVMRNLLADDRTIKTFVAPLPKEPLGGDFSREYEIRGTFLPENISDLVISPDTSRMFYLLPVGEGTAGIASGILGDKKSQVFDSPFREWLSQWPSGNLITLTTKPSYNVPGYMYSVNTGTKNLSRTLSEVSGLTTLTSPDGKFILYADNTLNLRVYNTETREVVPFVTRTLPEKCVWSQNNENIFCSVPKFISGSNYPDAWYKGEVSFSDEIWKLNVGFETAERISELFSGLGMEDMDNIKLALDQSESFLFFVNKKDSYLWELLLQ